LWLKDVLATYESKDKKKKAKPVLHTESLAKSALATKMRLVGVLDAVTKGKDNGSLIGIEAQAKELTKNGRRRLMARSQTKSRNTRWH
jgi:hypothetical protein